MGFKSGPESMTTVHYNKALPLLYTETDLGSERSRSSVKSYGVPGRKRRLPLPDLWWILLQLLCLSAAVLTVFWAALSMYLRQTFQLIIVGFLLAIMAMVAETQVLNVALMHIGRRSHASLQDFDALLRKDAFGSKVHICYRLLLLSLVALPLGLSVAYKNFIGGSTVTDVDSTDGTFGFSAVPGRQRIGDGLSLLTDVYVPFWINPAVNQTFGFNLYIPDNSSAVVVDSPYPQFVTTLQDTLKSDESLTLTTTVGATVAQVVDLTNEERNSSDFWVNTTNAFGRDYTEFGGVRGASNGFLMAAQNSNNSISYLSWWNTTSNETFESEAIRVLATRQRAQATWRIRKTNYTLIAASLVGNSTTMDQSIIQNNLLSLHVMFDAFLGEYDPHNRAGDFLFPYPISNSTNAVYVQPANTVPALVAGMIWARITSLDTNDRPLGIQIPEFRAITSYPTDASTIAITKKVPTLARSPLLMLVLCTSPLISIMCLLLRIMLLHDSQIGDGANLISALSAVRSSDLKILRGAAFSGLLERRVPVRFESDGVYQDEYDHLNNVRMLLLTPGKESVYG